MDDGLLLLTLHWLLAGIFAVALSHKGRAWPRFKAALAAYDIVPHLLVSPAALILAASEALALVLLLVWHPSGPPMAAVLLATYGVAIAVNVVRGRRHIDCGCGDEPVPVSWALVLRNICLIALALWTARLHAGGALTDGANWWSALIALALGLVGLGIYQAIEQLFANRGRHQRLWQGVG